MRPAYAVEYDFAYPTQLLPSLKQKLAKTFFWLVKLMALLVMKKRGRKD